MKTIRIIFLGQAILACLALPLRSQTGSAPAKAPESALLGQPVRATDLLGDAIKDSQDQKLGSVKDLAVDLDNGRIVEVIVARGGFMGVDQKLVAVPPQNFNFVAGTKTVRSSMDQQKLDGAPAVDLSKWGDATQQSRVEEVYQYFGAKPYFLVPEYLPKDANNPVMHPMKQVERAGHLLQISALNYMEANIGKVEDLIVDLPAGRLVEVIIDSSHFTGLKDELSAVPPQALVFSSDLDIVKLDTTPAALASAPHFPARSWPHIDRDQAGQVYRAYHVTPYFLPINLEGTTENASPSDGDIVTSLDAVEAKADMEITDNIRNDIAKADGLSPNARNIIITTLKGRVTLTGVVADAQEKRRLGRIAARYAFERRVDNRLVIKAVALN